MGCAWPSGGVGPRTSERSGLARVLWMMRLAILALVILAGGMAHAEARHQRLVTERGVVHVWTPDGYDPATAGIVVYLHGYYTTVDRAWTRHRLATQFANANINALFIACATPDNARRPIAWSTLRRLLAAVEERIGELPKGRRVAVAHSGGHRTLTNWLRDPALDTVVLLDALYDEEPEYRRWILGAKNRRLIDVSVLTREWTDPLHRTLRGTRIVEGLDDSKARESRIVYWRTDIDHMELVTGGQVLPGVLQMLSIPAISVNKIDEAPSSLM